MFIVSTLRGATRGYPESFAGKEQLAYLNNNELHIYIYIYIDIVFN